MLSEEAEAVVALTQHANQAFVNGDFSGYAGLYSHRDLSVAGPFGGAPLVGFDKVGRLAPTISQTFKGGSSRIEPIACYEAGDLMVLVQVEHQECRFVDGAEPEPWSLRVTQVYRKEEGQWRVVHRHADPLLARRSLDETRALAAKAAV
jgi:ketosteroid isomerase-like protein